MFGYKTEHKKQKEVLIAGCGRLGGSLAGVLSDQGYNVTIVDKDAESFRKLPPTFTGFQIEGDATDIDVLVKAGIEKADIVMATANDDNSNSMITQIASVIFGVNKVYARFYDTDKQNILKGLNIQAILPSMLSVHEFEKMNATEDEFPDLLNAVGEEEEA